MNTEQFIHTVSEYASSGEQFLFVIDFEKENPFVCRLSESADHNIFYNIKGNTNARPYRYVRKEVVLKAHPISKEAFAKRFEYVVHQQNIGNSYLLNLTSRTPIEINMSLEEIFHASRAMYKLLFGDQFVVFSPECFVKTDGNTICTFPMKGTINADTEDAAATLIGSLKEESEHNTIVDLMRNDISMVASSTEVKRYRYIERIDTHKSRILQTSSEITASLPADWRRHLGEILWRLLPAGSVSGAPKEKTLEIIRKAEGEPRGYYTGVFGIFDGANLDSAVMIRFIGQRDGKLFFQSGGGITAQSSLDDEYNELIEKIYVPVV